MLIENLLANRATRPAVSTGTGVLLIHGLGGTPNELRPVAEALRKAGHTVRTATLPGHVADASRLAGVGRREWLAALDRALDELSALAGRVVVGGLSMGAVLALRLALERGRDVDGLVLLAPALSLDGWAMPWTARVAGRLPAMLLPAAATVSERPPYGLKDPRIRAMVVETFRAGRVSEAGVFATPLKSIAEMAVLVREVERRLGEIDQPTLIVHPRQDDIASLANAHRLEDGLAGLVETIVLDDSYHLVTVDRQRRLVAERVCRFVAGLDDQFT